VHKKKKLKQTTVNDHLVQYRFEICEGSHVINQYNNPH